MKQIKYSILLVAIALTGGLYFKLRPQKNLRVPTIHDTGLTFKNSKADPGYLIVTYHSHPSQAFDSDGKLVKTFPGNHVAPISGGQMYIAGDVVSFANNKLEILWTRKDYSLHHMLSLDEEENFFFLSSRTRIEGARKIQVNLVVGLDKKGKEVFVWDEFENLAEVKEKLATSPDVYPTPNDQFFTHIFQNINGINVIRDNERAAHNPAFRKGNLLISEENRNLFIIDRKTKKIVFSIDTMDIFKTYGIHSPHMLPNGNILLYQNNSDNVGHTRIVELDPIKKEIVWEFHPEPPHDFYNRNYGGVYESASGTYVVADARNGRVFEITKDKELVWEWFNPTRAPTQFAAPLFFARKVPTELVKPFLEN